MVKVMTLTTAVVTNRSAIMNFRRIGTYSRLPGPCTAPVLVAGIDGLRAVRHVSGGVDRFHHDRVDTALERQDVREAARGVDLDLLVVDVDPAARFRRSGEDDLPLAHDARGERHAQTGLLDVARDAELPGGAGRAHQARAPRADPPVVGSGSQVSEHELGRREVLAVHDVAETGVPRHGQDVAVARQGALPGEAQARPGGPE